MGKYLVIREHAHSDFLVGKTIKGHSTVKRLLKDDHQILSILTVRHPVDSYLSQTDQDWLHFEPYTFNEYCKRYLAFINSNEGVPIFKYEDFIENPETELETMCDILNLPFDENFHHMFDIFNLTGDSGRSDNVIASRKRRKYDQTFLQNTKESQKYQKLCEKLGYEPSID